MMRINIYPLSCAIMVLLEALEEDGCLFLKYLTFVNILICGAVDDCVDIIIMGLSIYYE